MDAAPPRSQMGRGIDVTIDGVSGNGSVGEPFSDGTYWSDGTGWLDEA